jgi:hypothetical protein
LHLTLKHAGETQGRYPNNIVDPTPFLKPLLEVGKDGAAYVSDVIPDGTPFEAGAGFEQRWTLRNTGTTAWGDGYALAYFSGERLGAPLSVPVPQTNPGGLAEIRVNFQAPPLPGKYRSVWQMRAPAKPNGAAPARFGERMWVDILVPAPVPAPVFEGAAAPKDFFQGLAPAEAAQVAASAAVSLAGVSTLPELITAFEGAAAEEIKALVEALPMLAGLEVILRGHVTQLSGLTDPARAEALTKQALDEIVTLAKRLQSD